ncbi:hypothetical protein SAMN05192544_1007211 [Paraburkholderia hospita]|jgi:hypothetical protein|nr:hypothetical protein SAMN05192544_1007211 [Paraburkholderia hospita]
MRLYETSWLDVGARFGQLLLPLVATVPWLALGLSPRKPMDVSSVQVALQASSKAFGAADVKNSRPSQVSRHSLPIEIVPRCAAR